MSNDPEWTITTTDPGTTLKNVLITKAYRLRRERPGKWILETRNKDAKTKDDFFFEKEFPSYLDAVNFIKDKAEIPGKKEYYFDEHGSITHINFR